MSSDDITLDAARTRLREFGALVRVTRQERKVTLATLAQLLLIDEPLLSRIERGQIMPSVEAEQALRLWLGSD